MKDDQHKDNLEQYFNSAFNGHEDVPPMDVWNSLEDRLGAFNTKQKVNNAKKVRDRILIGTPILLALIWIGFIYSLLDTTSQKDTIQSDSHNFNSFHFTQEDSTVVSAHASNRDQHFSHELADNNITQQHSTADYSTTSTSLSITPITQAKENRKIKSNLPIINQQSLNVSINAANKAALMDASTSIASDFHTIIVPQLPSIQNLLVGKIIPKAIAWNEENEDISIDLPIKKQSRFSIELGVTPMQSFRNLKADETVADSEQEVLFFNQAEQAQLSMALDLRVNYHIGQRLFIQSGLNLNQWQQKGNYKNKVVTDSGTSLNSLLQTSYGVRNISFEVEEAGILEANELLDMSFDYREKVLFAELPLQLAYELGNGPLQLIVSTGASIALPVHQQINISDSQLAISNVQTNYIEKYSKAHLNIMADLGLSYEIMPNLAFQTYMHYQRAFTSVIDNKNYSLYPKGYGLRMSIKYDF